MEFYHKQSKTLEYKQLTYVSMHPVPFLTKAKFRPDACLSVPLGCPTVWIISRTGMGNTPSS
jgi:hypothetical protein